MIRIIAEACRNNKSDLLCCFVDFRKDFDILPRNNLWNTLEKLEVRVIAIRLYEKLISKVKNTEG